MCPSHHFINFAFSKTARCCFYNCNQSLEPKELEVVLNNYNNALKLIADGDQTVYTSSPNCNTIKKGLFEKRQTSSGATPCINYSYQVYSPKITNSKTFFANCLYSFSKYAKVLLNNLYFRPEQRKFKLHRTTILLSMMSCQIDVTMNELLPQKTYNMYSSIVPNI